MSMDYQSPVEEMHFSSDKILGFPAVKAKLWPDIIEGAKKFVEENEDEVDRESLNERLDAVMTLRTAREHGGKPAANVFRQVNEDIVRSEMSVALNRIMPGKVKRLWGRNDFNGLQTCFSRIFHNMQTSDSRLVKKMPILFLAGLVQIMHKVPSSRNSKWWEHADRAHKHLKLAMDSIAEGVKDEDKPCTNAYEEVFVEGMWLLNTYYGKNFPFHNIHTVVKSLDKLSHHSKTVSAQTTSRFVKYLERVHPAFAAELNYNLEMQLEIAKVCATLKGKDGEKDAETLSKYSRKSGKKVLVTSFLPVAKDFAYMMVELAEMWKLLTVDGYFQKISGIFEHAEEIEQREYEFAEGRAILLAVPLTFPGEILALCDINFCVRELLKRLPANGIWGKLKSRKRGRKARTPSPTASEEEAIVKKFLCDETDEEEESEDDG